MAPSAPPQRRLFLSCVTHEFRAYRDHLAASLAQPGVELRRQEDFVNAGTTTLEKLDAYIRTCDAVIHLVGDGVGAYPPPAVGEDFAASLSDFASRLGIEELLTGPGLSYTQWEAWLALYHKKPLALYRAADEARRETGFVSEPAQVRLQVRHWQKLKDLGRDRKDFVSPHGLSIDVLRSLQLMVPSFAENVRRGEFRDRNLLFAVLALQDEILTRESFVRICTLWAGATSQSLSELMQQEGLLTDADRQLVEARIARKLEHRGGDIRQTLAECLGGDIRQSLGDSLDPTTFVSLPDLGAMHGLRVDAGAWRYHLTRTHGFGGLGIVSVAEDSALERSVAVKRLRPERMLDPMAMQRFVREARITGRLQHPNIVPVYELGLSPHDQVPFYAMRFIGHRTLHDAITQHHADTKSTTSARNLRFRELLQSFLAVCNATAFAHDKGIIHRDLKPANVMIGDFGEVILLDWGLAKRVGEAEIPLSTTADGAAAADVEKDAADNAKATMGRTLAGARLGSPAYMAPEQAAGRVDLHSPLTDVYGLGTILYELLTGDVPFTGVSTDELLTAIQQRPLPDPCSKNAAVPPALAAVCRKALEKRPEDRYASAALLADDIQHWLADEPVSVLADTLVTRLQRRARKNPGPTSAIAAAMVVTVLGFGAGFYFVKQEQIKTVESSNLAARRFDEKRAALDEMMQTFGDDKLKGQPGSQPIRKLFLEKGLEQYQDMLKDQVTHPSVILRTGDVYRELGLVNKELGETDSSLELLIKAVDLCRNAVKARSGDRAMKAALGDALHEVAQAYFELQKYPEATPFAEESVSIYEGLKKQYPASIDYQAKLGRSLVRHASLIESKDTKMAKLKEALKLGREAVAAEPDNPHYLLYLGRATLNHALGDITMKREDVVSAYKEAEALVAKALRLSPALPLGHSLRMVCVRNASNELAKLGRPKEALEFVDAVVESSRTYLAENPAVLDGSVYFVILLNERARILEIMDRKEDAIQVYEELVQLNEALVGRTSKKAGYMTDSIGAARSVARIQLASNREPEAMAVYDKITRRSAQIMSRHSSSSPLLTALLQCHTEQAERLNENRRPDQALAMYQAGADLYLQFQPKLTGDSTQSRGNFLNCCRRAVEILIQKKDKDAALRLAEKYILPLAGLTNGKGLYDDELMSSLVALANTYKDAGRFHDQIHLINKVLEESNKTLGGDRSANWYAYQRVIGSYTLLAEAYRSVHEDRKAFEMLRKYFAEAVPYVSGRDHSTMLENTNEYNPENLAHLWQQHETVSGRMSRYKFTVPADFNGQKHRILFYVGETWEYLNDQFTWLSRFRGGVVAEDFKNSLKQLYKIAKDNKLSFVELCSYTMSPKDPSQVVSTLMEAPPFSVKSWDFTKDNMMTDLGEIEALKQKLEASKGGKLERRRLIHKYLTLSEFGAAKGQSVRAAQLLQDARSYFELDSEGHPAGPADAVLYCYANLIDSSMLAIQGKLEKAYELALGTLRFQSAETSEEFAQPKGELEFVLGWVCSRLGRSVEACLWYQKAAALGHDSVPRNLSVVYMERPEMADALSEDARRRLEEDLGKYMLEIVRSATNPISVQIFPQSVCYTEARKCGRAFQYVSLLKSRMSQQKPEGESSVVNAQLMGMHESIRQIAMSWLLTAVKKGYNDFAQIRKEAEFKPLHGLPEFEALFKK